ncbi:MAG: APA family basic amino acid/polyamine antiporter [Planctomycetota bacterium]|jgi:APA family basic amino acid/polyamine antiporter
MGGIIGVGIFFNPQSVAALVPHTGAYLSLWILGGILALAGALTFAELSATFPKSGGWFVFLREAFGPFPAFLFAWVVLLVVSTGACAVIADFSAAQFQLLLWPAGDAPSYAGTAIGLCMLVVITIIAMTGTKNGARFQNLCMFLKLGAVLALTLAGLLIASGETIAASAVLSELPETSSLANGMMQATLPVLFSYGGWQLVTYIAPKIENPQRTLPRSILIGVSGVAVVYLLVNFAYVRVLGIGGLATTNNFAAEVARRTLGPSGETILIAMMAVSSLGICAAIILATPGLYVAMAREKLFFSVFGREHARTGAPIPALTVQCIVMCLYLLWGRAGMLTDAVVFTEWIFHLLCGLALLSIRKHRPELERPFVSPAYPLFPIIYAGLAAAVLIGSLVTTPFETTRLGIGVLAIGAIVYRPWRNFLARQSAA